MPQLKIEAGGQTFTATLQDTPAARAFLERLPMTVSMAELNGNEKYFYMPDSLPTNSHRPGNIHAGDLMLYGSDCLVVFYLRLRRQLTGSILTLRHESVGIEQD